MRSYQRLLIVFIVALFMLPASNASARTFSDVHNYKDEIKYLTDQGILNGYTDGTFKPDRNINRLNGVQVLLKAKRITNFDAPNPNFTDMKPGSHGYAEVAKAVELGIISGKKNADGSSYFDPSGQLTRGQMAKVIVGAMDYSLDGSFGFRDVPKSNGFHDYISTLAVERITEGYADRTFKPNLPVSRQHFATFVARMLNDDFKPEPKPSSFLMDRTMDYTQEVDLNGKKSLSQLVHIGTSNNGSVVQDVWRETTNGKSQVFHVWENEDYLYTGFPESYAYRDLSYPIYQGKVFDAGWGFTETITSVGLTVKTKAGTFTNVVEVKSSDGYTVYYAPNVGAIKTIYRGKTTMELVKLTRRR